MGRRALLAHRLPRPRILRVTKVETKMTAMVPKAAARLDSTTLSAVASPRRREILRLIWSDERSAGDIHRAMPDVTFGAVSLQLRALSEAGLVEGRREGKQRFYRAKPEALGA